FCGNQLCRQLELALLQHKNLFFNGIARDELVGKYFVLLADAVSPVNSLCFHSGVPPGIEDENVICFSEVKSQTASLDRNKKYLKVLVFVESFDLFLPICA